MAMLLHARYFSYALLIALLGRSGPAVSPSSPNVRDANFAEKIGSGDAACPGSSPEQRTVVDLTPRTIERARSFLHGPRRELHGVQFRLCADGRISVAGIARAEFLDIIFTGFGIESAGSIGVSEIDPPCRQ